MRYRIKKIIRNNGTETYIPQVKKYRLWFWENIFDEGDITELRALDYIDDHRESYEKQIGRKVKKVEIINII